MTLCALSVLAALVGGAWAAYGLNIAPPVAFDVRPYSARAGPSWQAYMSSFYPLGSRSYAAPYDLPGPAGALARMYAQAGIAGRGPAAMLALHGMRGGIGLNGEIHGADANMRRIMRPLGPYAPYASPTPFSPATDAEYYERAAGYTPPEEDAWDAWDTHEGRARYPLYRGAWTGAMRRRAVLYDPWGDGRSFVDPREPYSAYGWRHSPYGPYGLYGPYGPWGVYHPRNAHALRYGSWPYAPYAAGMSGYAPYSMQPYAGALVPRTRSAANAPKSGRAPKPAPGTKAGARRSESSAMEGVMGGDVTVREMPGKEKKQIVLYNGPDEAPHWALAGLGATKAEVDTTFDEWHPHPISPYITGHAVRHNVQRRVAPGRVVNMTTSQAYVPEFVPAMV